jgi:hypothetical protein
MVGAGIAVLRTPPLGKERRVGVTVAARTLWGGPAGQRTVPPASTCAAVPPAAVPAQPDRACVSTPCRSRLVDRGFQ